MAKFYPLTRRQVKVVEVFVGTGDLNALWLDSLDISDRLAGNLGPVFTQDTLDLGDSFRAEDLFLGDGIEFADATNELSSDLADSIDISDQLAGNLGPVFAQDTLDLTDTLRGYSFQLADSIELSDRTAPITGPHLRDSIEISDQLAGNLGPIFAKDSFDLADTLDAGPSVMRDSLDLSDVTRATGTSRAPESIDFTDQMGSVFYFEYEAFDLADRLDDTSLSDVPDSIDLSDRMRQQVSLTSFADTVDLSDVLALLTVNARNPDSFDLSDFLRAMSSRFPDTIDFSDVRRAASITVTTQWLNAIQGTTAVFATPANFVDTDMATKATASIAQSGGLAGGSSQTANPAIQASFGDLQLPDGSTIGAVTLTYDWVSNTGGLLPSGNSVNMTPAYSLNDGGAWTNLPAITNAASSGVPTAALGALTLTQLNQLRFRWTGSITSGTVVIVGGATQNFNVGGANITYTITIPAGA